MIIALEGIDASGKATQSKMLVARMKDVYGYQVSTFDFPHYQSRTGKAILGLLTGKWGIKTRAMETGYYIDVGDMPPEKVADYITAVAKGLSYGHLDPELSKVADRTRVEFTSPKFEDEVAGKEIRALVLQALMTTNRLEVWPMLVDYAAHKYKHMVLDRYYASGLVYGAADGIPPDYLVEIHKALPPADLWIFIDIPSEESSRRRPERRDEYEQRAGFMEKIRIGYQQLFSKPPNDGRWVIVDGLGTAEQVHERIFMEVAHAHDPSYWRPSSWRRDVGDSR